MCIRDSLHISRWIHFYRGSFSYTSRACFIFSWGVSFTHAMLAYFFLNLGSFCYITRAAFIFMRGVSVTHLVLSSFLWRSFCYISRFFSFFFSFSGEFLLQIQCWLHFYLGSFCYTSHAGFIFIGWVSLTHPVLASFLPGEFILHMRCWLSFLSGDFILQILCWIYFSVGSFSNTSHAGFFFWIFWIWEVSLTHSVLASF